MVDWQDFLRHLIDGCFKICNNCDMKHHFKVHKFGFTLAEVLITLGIIGVVAALTIPQFISKYNELVIITELKKTYSELNQAIKLSEVYNGDLKTWDYSLDSKSFGENTYSLTLLKVIHIALGLNLASETVIIQRI